MSSVEFHNAPGRVMFRKICRLLQVCLSSNIMLHLAARYQVGDLSFSPILKIGPSPTATTPVDRGWPSLSARSNKDVLPQPLFQTTCLSARCARPQNR